MVAHPAAIVLALLLLRLQKAAPLQTVAATIVEPASERGRRGMDELHEQTINLLSFRELPKQIFDSQVAFNVISRYGDNARPPLETVERRIGRHFARITSGKVPAPGLMLLQGPSFHGHVFSIYVELQRAAPLREVMEALQGPHVSVVEQAGDDPSNVSAAGQDTILLTVRQDRERSQGLWLWAAADNLRLLALNAMDCAETAAAARPQGKVQ